MDQELQNILEKLDNNPIFKMSLGSKELFHSNFLEYLFTINKESFIKMINSFNPDRIQLPNRVEYQIGRELENFDLCIYHTVDGTEESKKIYDLVIENKVKSIPYKTQLEDYVQKAHNHNKDSNKCHFILLTLSKDFPDRDDEHVKDYWEVISYKTLKNGIKDHYLDHTSDKNKSYLNDYYCFIEQLDELKEYFVPKQKLILFDENVIKHLKKIRLHDLYIKLRCSWFAVNLKNRLKDSGIPTKIINKFEEREFGVVNINVAINQGNGQIAAWICDCDETYDDGKKKTNMFEIVIQGNQYRHGINQKKVSNDVKANNKHDKLNKLYDRLSGLADRRPLEFLNFQGAYNVGKHLGISPQPDKKKNFKKTSVQKSGPFDCYDEDYIYRYKKIDNIPISQLLGWMVEEAKLIFHNIPNLIDYKA